MTSGYSDDLLRFVLSMHSWSKFITTYSHTDAKRYNVHVCIWKVCDFEGDVWNNKVKVKPSRLWPSSSLISSDLFFLHICLCLYSSSPHSFLSLALFRSPRLPRSLPFRWPLTNGVTPAPDTLNVTSHLWLRPVLFIAGQPKCEGSQWEDKYKSQQAGRGVADEGRIFSLSLSSLSSPPNLKGKWSENSTNTARWRNHIQIFVQLVDYIVCKSTAHVWKFVKRGPNIYEMRDCAAWICSLDNEWEILWTRTFVCDLTLTWALSFSKRCQVIASGALNQTEISHFL